MECPQAIECINDAIDEALTDELQLAFNTHLGECDTCRAEYELMKSILADAANLTASIEPDRDLWSGIESAIGRAPQESSVVGFPARSMRLWAPLAAAAAVVLVMMGSQLRSTPNAMAPPEEVAVNPTDEPPALETPDEGAIVFANMESDYAQARVSLLEALEARKGELPEDLVVTIEENLNIIENAVVDIHRALEESPENPELERMLHAAYRSEMTLLQTVVQVDESDS